MSGEARDTNILAAMFCLGVYTLLAQMLVTRELLVVCLGNELTIGIVFSVWLVLVGAGAWGVRSGAASLSAVVPFCGTKAGRAGRSRKRLRSEWLFLWLALALPIVILALRVGAGWIRPVGEYPDLFHVFGATFLALAPLCIPAGMMFPLGCEAYPRGVSGVYAVEALGSFIAGAVFSFILIERFCVMQIVAMGVTVSLAGGLCAMGMRRRGAPPSTTGAGGGRNSATPYLLASGVVSAAILGCVYFPFLAGLDCQSAAWRWAALGVTREAKEGQPAVVLKGGADTRYQNLALMESQGLFTLYGDGQVMFSFPDEITSERAVNFVMAQKPDARRILLIGGNPAGELPYLLKYPVQEVVHVERDPAIDALVQRTHPALRAPLQGGEPDSGHPLMLDPLLGGEGVGSGDKAHVRAPFWNDLRLKRVYDDGPRFVKRCKTVFDVVLIHAPEPTTGGLNRFYTREFYENVRAILAPGGFIHTSVEASERLERDASRMAGSIYRTLSSVFPVVKVTAGSPLQFFASRHDGGLTDDREELYRRSASAKVSRTSFQPLYFLDADEWEPGKVALTRKRLEDADAPINTIQRPVSCYYTLVLWSRYSGSSLSLALRWLEMVNPWALAAGIMGLGGIGILVGLMVRRRYPAGVLRMATGKAMAVTGFCGVALELILLYAFQGFYGYVYGRMGLMVGLFMLGTVLGAWRIRWIESAEFITVRRAVMGGLVKMAALALTVWMILIMSGTPPEWMLYGLTLATGIVVGMQFVAVSRLLAVVGIPQGEAAGWAWLADYVGSALGGLVAGVFLVALFGIAATCGLLAVLLGVSLVAISLNPEP